MLQHGGHLPAGSHHPSEPMMHTTPRPSRTAKRRSRLPRHCAWLFLLLVAAADLRANNVQVSNIALTGQNTASDFTMVRFDIGWENSWRTSTLESNWDAAWVFVKYRRTSENIWNHALLNNTGHNAPAGCTITPGVMNTSLPFAAATNPAVGAFIHRSADGIGNINFANVQLRWNYGANGLADFDSVEVCVFAIEMVLVPQGAFWVGDEIFPGSNSSGRFVAGSTTTNFQVTSEATLTIGNTAPTELWGTGTNWNNTIGPAGSLPAAFPKGFGTFYLMKYEVSQLLYREFLNKLTRAQQVARVSAVSLGIFMRDNNTGTTPTHRNGIKVMTDPGENTPRVYGNDLNNNGIEGESGDGQHIACNFLSYEDARSFADWCGLRPYSELEYEKACRGTLNPVTNESAWGNTNVAYATSIANAGQPTERAGNTGSNCVFNSAGGVQGPLRCGSFAGPTTTRELAGAGYYGAMELSGNLFEYCLSVGVTTQRTLNRHIHGNGFLPAWGTADATWPTDCGLRGGSWVATGTSNHQTSDRQSANTQNSSQRIREYGVRLARTDP